MLSKLAEFLKSAWAKARAFFWGAWEFRSSVTLAYDDPDLSDAYDAGRELAHKLTFRRFER